MVKFGGGPAAASDRGRTRTPHSCGRVIDRNGRATSRAQSHATRGIRGIRGVKRASRGVNLHVRRASWSHGDGECCIGIARMIVGLIVGFDDKLLHRNAATLGDCQQGRKINAKALCGDDSNEGK
jgi:hypothetical protein